MESKRPKTQAELQYADIIALSRPVSPRFRPMPRGDRAAQFAAFAALTGYEDAVAETARLTDERPTLTEDKKQTLDETLRLLCSMSDTPPPVRVTYFRPDERKKGGSCRTVTGGIRDTDPYEGVIVLADQSRIPLEDLLDIELL